MNEKAIQQIKQRYNIVGNYEGLNRCIDIAIQVAPTDLSVLICGESGVGKEVLPRVIHDNSTRKHNKYFAINCGSLPEGTIDSELFGHKKGAFTGALDDREGYFSVANNGTLFLDEVGELPLATQARLLRVLETGEYIRVGESEVRKTNVRIIAATNVNMAKAIKERKFREDLYYRLNTIPISIPPLRERGRDIELLFRKFAYDIAEKYHIEPVRLTEEARRLLLNYKWPGNIRQLRNLTEHISIINEKRDITADDLARYSITDDTQGAPGLVLANGHADSGNKSHSYEQERDLIFSLLHSISNEMKELKSMMHGNMGGMGHIQSVGPRDVNMDIYPTADMPQRQSPYANHNPFIINEGGYKRMDNMPYDHTNIQDIDVVPVEEDNRKQDEPETYHDIMKRNIIEALRRNRGNRKRTAQELGLSERTIYRKIQEYGLDV